MLCPSVGFAQLDKAYLKFPAVTTSVILLSILKLLTFIEQWN